MTELRGTLDRIIFESAQGGFVVARLALVGGGEPLAIVGDLAGLVVGEELRVEGEYEEHPRHGRQFRVQRAMPVVPATREGVERYLGSGLISGVGPAMAQRLCDHFGAEVLEITESHPERLTEVEGIGPKRAAAIAAAIQGQRVVREVMVFLQGHGVSPALAARIYRAYGDQSIATVRQHPFRLAREVTGIGFATADRIARSLGIAADAPERIEAGVLQVMADAEGEGHAYLPEEQLQARAAAMLGVAPEECGRATTTLAATGALVAEPVPEGIGLFGPVLHRAEVQIAAHLLRLTGAARRRQEVPAALLAPLSSGQAEAVAAACREPVVVLTGGPGTGKTTCLKALVAVSGQRGERLALCAPTGRAAKRLSEATGAPATTVHRLLEFGPKGRFAYDETRPLSIDQVVCDEASMLDLTVARALLAAIPDGARLLLCGDVDQLPSVGPGAFLGDVCKSRRFPIFSLTEIFRQAEGSRIVVNAHRINRGELPQAAPPEVDGGDFYIVSCDDPARARDIVTRICSERIPQVFGYHPRREVQVLTPMHRGEAGTETLNRVLQEALNPPGDHKDELRGRSRVYRVGDKVMQLRNDYLRDVYNGDVGEVVAVEEEGGLVVGFDGRSVLYRTEQVGELEHAFAMSVHKAQGSEYPAVIIVLLAQHYVMLQRNLLYTAVTRARRLVVLVASPRALRRAVRNAETTQRFTRLGARLVAS